jgi:uracil-DNA glycosylase
MHGAMDARTEANRQLAAYALWLEERGLRTPSFRVATAATVSHAEGTPSHHAESIVSPPDGSPPSALMFVGDRPFTADEQALLAKIIAALALAPDQAPTLEDAAPDALRAAIARHRPAAVVLLGVPTLRTAIAPQCSFRQLLGRIFRYATAYGDTPFLVTLHPRDLLRFPANKRQAWDDLQRAAAFVRSQTCAH